MSERTIGAQMIEGLKETCDSLEGINPVVELLVVRQQLAAVTAELATVKQSLAVAEQWREQGKAELAAVTAERDRLREACNEAIADLYHTATAIDSGIDRRLVIEAIDDFRAALQPLTPEAR